MINKAYSNRAYASTTAMEILASLLTTYASFEKQNKKHTAQMFHSSNAV